LPKTFLPDPSAKRKETTGHHITFHSERRKPEKTQDRHLKDFEPAHMGNGVLPLGSRPKIPELPEETAYQPRGQEEIEGAKRAFLPLAEKRRRSQTVIDGLQQEDEASPDQGKEVPRPNEREEQKQSPHPQENLVKPGRRTSLCRSPGLENSKVVQEALGGEDPGDDRGEGNGIPDPPGEGAGGHIMVFPVV